MHPLKFKDKLLEIFLSKIMYHTDFLSYIQYLLCIYPLHPHFVTSSPLYHVFVDHHIQELVTKSCHSPTPTLSPQYP